MWAHEDLAFFLHGLNSTSISADGKGKRHHLGPSKKIMLIIMGHTYTIAMLDGGCSMESSFVRMCSLDPTPFLELELLSRNMLNTNFYNMLHIAAPHSVESTF